MSGIPTAARTRYLKGVMGNPADTTAFKQRIDLLAEAALKLARSLD